MIENRTKNQLAATARCILAHHQFSRHLPVERTLAVAFAWPCWGCMLRKPRVKQRFWWESLAPWQVIQNWFPEWSPCGSIHLNPFQLTRSTWNHMNMFSSSILLMINTGWFRARNLGLVGNLDIASSSHEDMTAPLAQVCKTMRQPKEKTEYTFHSGSLYSLLEI